MDQFSCNCYKKNPYHVTEMKRGKFLSTKALEECICNRKTNTKGGKVNWWNIKWLRYCKNKPNIIFYKETLQDNFPSNEINISKPSSKEMPPNLFNIVQIPLYPDRRPVKEIKKKHMMQLLSYIPPHYHPFYKGLPVVSERTRASTSKTGNNSKSEDSEEYIDWLVQEFQWTINLSQIFVYQ